MNNLDKERQIINDVLNEYLVFLHTYSSLQSKLIISEDKNNYLIILYGLLNDKNEYFHDFIVHLEIINSRIHILHDCIDIRNKLSNAGMTKNFVHHNFSKPSSIDFAISLEKIYKKHKSIFATETSPKQPKIKLNATSEELATLSKIESKYIGSAIASHPNISIDLLLELFSKYPAAVFANPNFNKFMDEEPDLLRSLYNAFHRIFFEANDLVLPDFFIEWALTQKNLRAYICGSHKIPIKYLERLINDEKCSVFANMMCRLGRQGSCKNIPGNYPLSQDIAQKIEEKYSYFQSICPEKDEYGFCNGVCMEIISCM